MTMPEAVDLWRAERRERLAANLLAQRPAAFDVPGDLDAASRQWADDLAAGNGRNLILTGPVGTGKTWSLWHAAERAVRAGYEGLVVVASAAKLRRIVAPVHRRPAGVQPLTNAGLLALDDLGVGAAIRMGPRPPRRDRRRPLVSPAADRGHVEQNRSAGARSGPRISSRLADRALVVELDGPDRRRQS